MCYIIDPQRETIKVLEDQLTAITAERDRYRDAWEKANEHISDAWALSVDYDGFDTVESLKGLIDDIVHNMNLGRKIMNEALKGKQ
jgi:hypothetical protein